MRYTSRKLVFCVALVAIATYLLTRGLISEATWLTIAAAALQAYVLGNVGQKAVEKFTDVFTLKRSDPAGPAAPGG